MANGRGLEGRGGQRRPAPSSSATSLPLHAKRTLIYARRGRGLASTFLMMGGRSLGFMVLWVEGARRRLALGAGLASLEGGRGKRVRAAAGGGGVNIHGVYFIAGNRKGRL